MYEEYFKKTFTADVYLLGLEEVIGDKAITASDINRVYIDLVDFNCLCFNLYRIIGPFYKMTPTELYNKKYSLKIKQGNDIVFEEAASKSGSKHNITVLKCKDDYIKETITRELFRDNPSNSTISRIW